MIERGHPELSVRRQCELMGMNRSSLYYQRMGESAYNLHLMRLLDEQYTRTPFKSRKLYPEGCEIPNRQTIAPYKSLRGPEEQFRPALHSCEMVGNRVSAKGHCLARGPEVDRQYERDG